MKAAQFDLHRPETLQEAITLLAEFGDEAKPLAGGQSLVPVLALRLGAFEHLVDLSRIEGLTGIRRDGGVLRIGAMTRQTDVLDSPLTLEHAPLLAAATQHIGHFQIRNRGTIGGSVAHADPAAEYPAAMLALDAQLTMVGPAGPRVVPAPEFFLGPFTTALTGDEILTEIAIPLVPWSTSCAVQEFSRRSGDFAIAGAMCRIGVTGGTVRSASLSLFGLAGRPILCEEPARDVIGQSIDDVDADAMAAKAVANLQPIGDLHGSAEYRRHLGQVLSRRAVQSVIKECKHG